MCCAAFGFGPGSGREGFDFGGLGFGQTLEEVLEIFGGINAVAPATTQHGIDHRTALAGFGMPDEQEILFPNGRGANGIFAKIMPRPGLCRMAEFFSPAEGFLHN